MFVIFCLKEIFGLVFSSNLKRIYFCSYYKTYLHLQNCKITEAVVQKFCIKKWCSKKFCKYHRNLPKIKQIDYFLIKTSGIHGIHFRMAVLVVPTRKTILERKTSLRLRRFGDGGRGRRGFSL